MANAEAHHAFKRPRRVLVPAALAGSTLTVAWGLTHSPIVVTQPWNESAVRQCLALCLGVGLAALSAAIVEWRWRLRTELTLLVLFLVVCAILFGPRPVLSVGLFLLASLILGGWLTGLLASRDPLPFPFMLALGVAIYGMVFSLLAPLRVNGPILHAALVLAPLLIGPLLPRSREMLADLVARIRTTKSRAGPISALGATGLLAFASIAMLHACFAALPERYWDAMVMHLYIPSYVSGNRAWDFDADSYVWAYMPAGVDWLYTHFFLLGGELSARLYNLSAFMLLCAVLYSMARRCVSADVAVWFVTLFAAMPIAFLETSTLFIEHTVALWITAAGGMILISDLKPDVKHVIATLAFLAIASMSKLHGAVAAAIIGPLVLALFLKQRPTRRQIASSVIAAGALGLIGCFPYIFAWARTGNPLFPFYNDVFQSPFFPPVAFQDTRWIGHLDWRLLYDTTFFSGRFLEAESGALGLTAIFLLPLAAAALLARPEPRLLVTFLIGLCVAVPILLQIQYLRYIYPVFPLLFLPAAASLQMLTRSDLTRHVAPFALAALAAFNVYKAPAAGWLLYNPDFKIIFDATKRREFEIAFAPERLANALVNSRTGSNARVLYTGAPYGALLQGKALYTDWYNVRLSEAFAKLGTAEQAQQLLEKWKVTHVIHNDSIPKAGQAVMGQYLAGHYRPVAQFGRALVYELSAGLRAPDAGE